MKGQHFSRRLHFALLGLKRTLRAERSFRTHLAAAAGMLAVLLVTRPAPVVDTPPIPRRARPLVQDCSPDLATLGLCNP